MTQNITTTIHAYSFDVRDPQQKAAWEELRDRLTAEGLKAFESLSPGPGHYAFVADIDGRTVKLETAHLFDNQWNTAPIDGKSDKGLRVFDWALDARHPNFCPAHVYRGHYLEQTPEMAEARRNRYACGYCGKQEPAAKGYTFCPHCIDSEYLTEDRLHLTRMKSVASEEERAPLTDAERAHLLPLYRDAQIHGATERGKARIKKQREQIKEKHRKAIHAAETERAGLLWLLDHGIKIDNVIYYNHRDVFTFGWRQPVSADVASAFLDVASEFPFAYEIKCADGRTLNNHANE